jgi:hypothetical protein
MGNNDSHNSIFADLLLAVNKELGEMNGTLGEIRADLAHHIKRTELLEEKVSNHDRHLNRAYGAVILIGVISTLCSIFVALKQLH